MVLSGCSRCNTHVCRGGFSELGPEACPMRHDFPDAGELYADPNVREVARVAALVESAGYRRWRRAEEIMEFAHRLQFSKLGVVFCNDMASVANLYIDVLKTNGFQTVAAGSRDGDCDPVAGAALCNDEGTQLNVLLGMHVGHDALFIRHSRAWVTSLVARDRVLAHNPVGALYGAKGYFSQALREHNAGAASDPGGDMADQRLSAAAGEVADLGGDRWSRVEETLEFARRLGVVRLGLVFCVGLSGEAATLTDILETNGFEVASAACKTGGVPKEYVGVSDSEKVRPGRPEMMCNPVGQMEILNRNHTELNILMGQCVGHDSLSMRHSEAPVVCLVAKDRLMAHNTVAALYESQGYLNSALSQHKAKQQGGDRTSG